MYLGVGILYSGLFKNHHDTLIIKWRDGFFVTFVVVSIKLNLVMELGMGVLLKFLPIYGLPLVAQLWLNYFDFKFLFSKIKTGDYTVPFINHTFEWLSTFTLAAWTFNAIFCFIPATILVAYSYKISVDNFHGLSSALIINQIASIMTSVLFVRLISGETLNRNGWIAIILFFLALPFAMHSTNSP